MIVTYAALSVPSLANVSDRNVAVGRYDTLPKAELLGQAAILHQFYRLTVAIFSGFYSNLLFWILWIFFYAVVGTPWIRDLWLVTPVCLLDNIYQHFFLLDIANLLPCWQKSSKHDLLSWGGSQASIPAGTLMSFQEVLQWCLYSQLLCEVQEFPIACSNQCWPLTSFNSTSLGGMHHSV